MTTVQRKEVCPLSSSFSSLSWRSLSFLFPSCHKLGYLGAHSEMAFRVEDVCESMNLGWTPEEGKGRKSWVGWRRSWVVVQDRQLQLTLWGAWELKEPNAGPLYSLLHLSLVVDHRSVIEAMQGGLVTILAAGAYIFHWRGTWAEHHHVYLASPYFLFFFFFLPDLWFCLFPYSFPAFSQSSVLKEFSCMSL